MSMSIPTSGEGFEKAVRAVQSSLKKTAKQGPSVSLKDRDKLIDQLHAVHDTLSDHIIAISEEPT
ncbi:hypothetical protein KIPB_015445, partial [Kipferlia bialata]|eukprot:g15445.t1